MLQAFERRRERRSLRRAEGYRRQMEHRVTPGRESVTLHAKYSVQVELGSSQHWPQGRGFKVSRTRSDYSDTALARTRYIEKD